MQIIKFRFISTLLFMVLLQAGCSEQPNKIPEMLTLSGSTMGTTFHLKYYASSDPLSNTENIRSVVRELLDSIEQKMSTYLPDSEISRFNRAEANQWVAVSQQTLNVINIALTISHNTHGAFDVSVAPLVNLWGFGPNFSTDSIPAPQTIKNMLKQIDYHAIQLRDKPPAILKTHAMSIDLSGVAKGYAVDQVAELLNSLNIKTFMVEIGGEIRTHGRKNDNQSWKIGVESPQTELRSVQRILEISDWAVATSGDYRNFFEKDGKRYSHTIDPVTGYPVTHNLASVTILTQQAAQADALATALVVMGPTKALLFANTHKLLALLIIRDGTTYAEIASTAFQQHFNRGD